MKSEPPEDFRPAVGTPASPSFGEKTGEKVELHIGTWKDGRWSYLYGDDGAPGFEVALRPVAGGTASGRAVLASADAGIKMRLWVRGLPRDPGIVYEVQCDAPGWSASAGTFRADAHGRAYVVLNTAARRGEYDAISVVRRERSSSTDVLQAKL